MVVKISLYFSDHENVLYAFDLQVKFSALILPINFLQVIIIFFYVSIYGVDQTV